MSEGLERRSILFIRHQARVKAYVRALIDDPSDAEDLLQEIGVLIVSRKDEPVTPQDFRVWCRSVARNLALHYWRSRRRGKEIPSDRFLDLVDEASARADAQEDLWGKRRAALARCVETLADRERELLMSRYVDGQTSDAIAEGRQQSPGAVRMTLMRIRDRLLQCIERRLVAPAEGASP